MEELDGQGGLDRRAERARAIEEFVSRFADGPHRDIAAEMMVTICRLAVDHPDRGEMKLLTTALKELRYAFKVFGPHRDTRKVSIFGSSRTACDHPEYLQADAFARRMRENSWMVITGAGDGIMRAGHCGAGVDASFGVAIRLPFEQRTNQIIAGNSKLVNFKYFFTRKLLFIKEASAVALFPGGFGTQDEGFEALVLIQTGKAALMPVVCVDAPGGTYWQHWRTYVAAELLRTGMISPEDMHLFKVTDDVEVAVREITNFYRRYHSSRYVGDVLVIRMNSALPESIVSDLADKYHGIIPRGKLEQFPGPIEGEGGELPDKPRLTMTFDRRSIGLLRQLIDDLNAVAASAANGLP